MILMHHHVCPRQRVPAPDRQAALEGWAWTIEPEPFEQQLRTLRQRGFELVSLPEYVARCEAGALGRRTATLTFDDGWRDNFEYAWPILERLRVPAAIFVVSGEMPDVPRERRMSDAQLRELADAGVTIGSHSRSHSDLTALSQPRLGEELGGCKQDLEQRLGRGVEFLAYPGGEFDRAVVEATKQAGYRAACSVIGGGINGAESLFWLYRDVFSAGMGSLRDRIFLNPRARALLDVRARRRLRAVLAR